MLLRSHCPSYSLVYANPKVVYTKLSCVYLAKGVISIPLNVTAGIELAVSRGALFWRELGIHKLLRYTQTGELCIPRSAKYTQTGELRIPKRPRYTQTADSRIPEVTVGNLRERG